jgi:hypothetical protein
VEVGKSDISRICRLCNSYDKLQSKWSQPTTKHAKRYRYKKAGARIQRHIRNLVDEFHKKTTKWVCEITVLYSYPNLRLRRWFLNIRGKLTQRLLEICLFGVTTDSRRDWWTRLESTQTAELLFAVKSTLVKLAANVDIFIARLEAQRSSNAQDVIKNLIETLM